MVANSFLETVLYQRHLTFLLTLQHDLHHTEHGIKLELKSHQTTTNQQLNNLIKKIVTKQYISYPLLDSTMLKTLYTDTVYNYNYSLMMAIHYSIVFYHIIYFKHDANEIPPALLRIENLAG